MKSEVLIIRQRTAEWYTARLGKFTASNFATLMSGPVDKSSQFSKSALSYIMEVAMQLYLNKSTFRQDTVATRWGMKKEGEALLEFERVTGFAVNESGFILHPQFPDVGATPDAIVVENNLPGNLVLAQVKCPFSQKNHLQYTRRIHDAVSLKKYRSSIHWQIQGELWVTGASHSYFVSFDPRQWGSKRLHYARIERDQLAAEELEAVIKKAIVLRNEFLASLREAANR
jgi:hypothetical protein